MSENEIKADPAAAPVRTSLLAVASFCLGIFGLLWLGAIYMAGLLMPLMAGLFESMLRDLAFAIPWLLAILLGLLAKRVIRTSSLRLAGAGLARAGIALGAWSIVLGIVLTISHFGEFMIRRSAIRLPSEMRSVANAMEAYRMDTGAYPAWAVGANGPGGIATYNYWIASLAGIAQGHRTHPKVRRSLGPFFWYRRVPYDTRHPADLPGFLQPGQGVMTLTTPITYVSSYSLTDRYSPLPGAQFVYWSIIPGQLDPSGKIVGADSPTSGVGWILLSPGPDRKYDILPDDWGVYNPAVPQPSKRLLTGTNKKGRAFTYDPTNGTISDGDIWRVKQ